MADGLNLVFCMGYLGSDPDLKTTQSGQSVLTLSVACNESYLDRNRQRQEKVEWIRCTVWGRRAEALAKFLKKGTLVTVEGKLQTNSWQDREGIKRYSTTVVARNIIVGGSNNPRGNSKRRDPERERANRRDEEDSSAPAGGGGSYDDQDYGSGGGFGGDEDIPFLRIAHGSRESWWRFGSGCG